jgi:hypothetical protein
MNQPILLFLVLLAWPRAAGAEASHDRAARVAHLERALEAMEAVTDEWLIDTYNYLYAVERNQCQAPLQSMTCRCLLEAARRNCRQADRSRQERCERISDVIITTRISEDHFISRAARFRILSEHTDFRAALQGALRRRYAALVTEMTMSQPCSGRDQGRVEIAQAIDQYCRRAATTRRLSWQHCAGAIIWFIGTSGRLEGLGDSL